MCVCVYGGPAGLSCLSGAATFWACVFYLACPPAPSVSPPSHLPCPVDPATCAPGCLLHAGHLPTGRAGTALQCLSILPHLPHLPKFCAQAIFPLAALALREVIKEVAGKKASKRVPDPVLVFGVCTWPRGRPGIRGACAWSRVARDSGCMRLAPGRGGAGAGSRALGRLTPVRDERHSGSTWLAPPAPARPRSVQPSCLHSLPPPPCTSPTRRPCPFAGVEGLYKLGRITFT